jgi:hypothetical protein
MGIVENKEGGTIGLTQEQYTKEIMATNGMLDSTPSRMPIAPTYY